MQRACGAICERLMNVAPIARRECQHPRAISRELGPPRLATTDKKVMHGYGCHSVRKRNTRSGQYTNTVHHRPRTGPPLQSILHTLSYLASNLDEVTMRQRPDTCKATMSTIFSWTSRAASRLRVAWPPHRSGHRAISQCLWLSTILFRFKIVITVYFFSYI